MIARRQERPGKAPAPSTAVNRRQTVYLQPGQLVAPRLPTAVKTILGSCISVCLWDAEHAVGGANHFILPYGSPSAEDPSRFGNFAMPLLIDAVIKNGAARESLRAKVFGGAAMIAGGKPRPNHIGMQNFNIASEQLAAAGIPIVSSDTGGARGRKIVFLTDTGEVALWEL